MSEPAPDRAAPGGRTVLLLGGTGRTGGRVLELLLQRGVHVRAVVRSAARLPAGTAGDPLLSVTEADLPSLGDRELAGLALGCDAVVSCLGHVVSLRGIYGPPRDLVTHTARRVCRTIAADRPDRPVRFVLMSSVSVNDPGGQHSHRGTFERLALCVLRALVPPARDNQRAADFFVHDIGAGNASVEWAVVRPDTLREGDVTAYALHEGLVDSLFRPGATNMANVADFMCRLVTDDGAWAAWRDRLPVIVNEAARRPAA